MSLGISSHPAISAFEHILLRTGNEPMSEAREKLLVFMTTLCNWSLPVSTESRDILVELVKILEGLGESKEDDGKDSFIFVGTLIKVDILYPP